MDISGSTLSYYLNKLVDADILLHVRAGAEKGYQIKDRNEIIKILIAGRIKPPSQIDGFITTWNDFLYEEEKE
jgi:hypothetical protein